MRSRKQALGTGFLLVVTMVAGAFALPRTLVAAELTRTDKTIDGFLTACRANKQLTDEQRNMAIELVTKLRQDEEFKDLAITEALRRLYPEFAAALTALGEEEIARASDKLKELSAAKDRFLAAESTFFLARAYLMDERFEEALPLLEKVVSKWSDSTLQAGQALFLQGVSQSRMLQRKKAIQSLTEFIKQNPDAPERMRVGAWRHIQLLQLIDDGSLVDVQDRMDFSRRRLSLENSGKKTRDVQDGIIAMLDKLIKQAEKKEKSGQCSACQGKGCKQCQGSGKSGGKSGAGGNTAGRGQSTAKADRRTHRGGPRTPWDDLVKKNRNPRTFAALKAKFPARYQQLVEQYYRSFQEDTEE